MEVSRRPIAADADADGTRAAPLSLRLPHGVENGFLDAFDCSVRSSQMRQLGREGVLGIRILAPAAFENQLDLDCVALPLVEVDDRRPRAEVIAGILSGD